MSETYIGGGGHTSFQALTYQYFLGFLMSAGPQFSEATPLLRDGDMESGGH